MVKAPGRRRIVGGSFEGDIVSFSCCGSVECEQVLRVVLKVAIPASSEIYQTHRVRVRLNGLSDGESPRGRETSSIRTFAGLRSHRALIPGEHVVQE